MKKCEFCDNIPAVLIEFDDGLECDPSVDKWTCSDCEGHPTFLFINNIHFSTEFWYPKEFDENNRLTMSLVLRQNFALYIEHYNKYGPPAFALEIIEYRGPLFMKPIYRSNEWPNITSHNARQKLETILTFR